MYVEIKCQLDATEVFIADLLGILFPHINDDARSKSHQICLSIWSIIQHYFWHPVVIHSRIRVLQNTIMCNQVFCEISEQHAFSFFLCDTITLN